MNISWKNTFKIAIAITPLLLIHADYQEIPLDEMYNFITLSEEENQLFEDSETSKKQSKKVHSLKAESTYNSSSIPPLLHFEAYIKHKEGGGIGYSNGYTTVETLLGFGRSLSQSLFLDLRAHLLNNVTLAGNAGFGYRFKPWEDNSLAFGFNTYYDLRFSEGSIINQIGSGFELFSNIFDFRLNGYAPFTHTKKTVGIAPGYFEGHNLILNKEQKLTLGGLDAEIGKRILCIDNCSLYLAIGAYYLKKDDISTDFGKKLRLSLDLFKRITLEGSISNDSLFKTKLQGQIALHFPFGPHAFKNEKKRDSCKSWPNFYEAPIRNEIVPIKRATSQTLARDSIGNPLYFVHVNNTGPSNGNGTFEEPYQTLSSGSNNTPADGILYLHFGNGEPYEEGLSMYESQQLIGSGSNFSYTNSHYGNLTIPGLTPGLYPLIANTGSSNAGIGINVSANSKVINISGVNVAKCTSSGIQANAGDYTLNIFNSKFIDNAEYLDFQNTNANLNSVTVTIASDANTYAVLFGGNFSLKNSSITGSNSSSYSTILVDPSNNLCSFTMLNNTIYHRNDYGLELNPSGSLPVYSFTNSRIQGNSFTGLGASGSGGIELLSGATSTSYSDIAIVNNVFTGYSNGIYIDSNIASASGTIQENVFNGATTSADDINPSSGGGLTVGSNSSSTAQ